MNEFNETMAIFDGSDVKTVRHDVNHALRRTERQANLTYRAFAEDEETFDFSHVMPRWWPVETPDDLESNDSIGTR